MTLARRVALGTALGAVIALLAHPRSRPMLLTSFIQFGPSASLERSPDLPLNLDVLPVPRDELDCSLWMQVGAERLTPRKRLSPQQLGVLAKVADAASSLEPENAYWYQMAAVFYHAAGRRDIASRRWGQGALALRWDDHQSVRLQRIAESLARESGGPLAWHYARAYSLRSRAAAIAIELYGRSVVSSAPLETREGLDRRIATLKNGILLRDGCRSLQAGESGVKLIELASYPRLAAESPSPRALLLARFAFIEAIRENGLARDADYVNSAYLTNDAWLALAGRDRASEEFRLKSAASVATATLPSGLLVVAAIGVAISLVAASMKRSKRLHAMFRAPYLQVLGISLAAALYALTRMPLVALTGALCVAFLAFGPAHVRKQIPSSFGPFFAFTVLVLAILFSGLIGAFWVGLTTPALEILPLLDAPPEFYGGQSLPVGLAGIVLALLLLVGPSWAIVLRLPTPHVTFHAIGEFGRITWSLSVALLMLLLPISIVADDRLGDALQKTLADEPNYYLQQ